MGVLETIRDFNAGREPRRLAMKCAAMRASSFAFLRGTCHLFYGHPLSGAVFSKAPKVWVCGDLHLENFGSYKADNRLVYFDLNDFDESALAPATWELVRLQASILTAADSLDISPELATSLCQSFADAYADALTTGHALSIERETAQGLIKTLLDSVHNRTRKEFLDRRTQAKGRRRTITCDHRHALEATAEEKVVAAELVEAFAATQPDPKFFEPIDIANRIAGTGSLGVERYMVLVAGKGAPDGNYLLDLKLALPSSLEQGLSVVQPKWPSQAHRVVELQRRMQAVSAAFLCPLVRSQRSYVLRGLQPSEDRVTLGGTHVTADQLRDVIQEMGRLVAWAQLRSSGRQGSAIADELIAFGADRTEWRSDLLAAASQCAEQMKRDWQVYCKAYDAGAFGPRASA
jgi:uncharacterized protein (DUF2252 family)